MPSAEQQTAQLAAGVTELWRGGEGETELEAWGPAPAMCQGSFCSFANCDVWLRCGYNVTRDNKWSAAAQAACLTCAGEDLLLLNDT